MNDNDLMKELLNSVVSTGALTYPVLDGNSLTATTAITGHTISPIKANVDDILDEFAMNRLVIDHKVTAQELLKLQEVAPDFAKEIKENIAKNLARDIATKVSYTKKHDKDADVHHYIGRVWVFTEEELKAILEKR